MRNVLPVLFASALLVSCASDEEHGGGGGGTAPAAPTGLAVAKLGGGAHLTWTDASDNEDHFMIMRKAGGGAYAEVDMVTFNATQYHDEPVTAGTTYVYKVLAMNGGGESSSNEVTFTP